jgi:tetratricopeptide (TPR) repeat protein
MYELAVFGGDASGLAGAERDLTAVEADVALARGRLLHARYLEQRGESHDELGANGEELALFERAAHLYRALGDVRGEGEALFWIGAFHQVVRGDNEVAVPVLERAQAQATEAQDTLTISYVLRHLGIAEHTAGRLDAARANLEESTRIRREIGFLPGVAANLVGLAYIAAGQGRHKDAGRLIEEADEIAKDRAPGILAHVGGARRDLTG